ncbi:hypothetical protein [Okeania sp.]|uniref:hypothetical protein n=1 Tax=Okeania sp. TaxID=3100323 RepID=UPI002B4B1F07|nr:hypothetical protein [Okeania sp.]
MSILNTVRRPSSDKKEFPPNSGNFYETNSVVRTIGYREKIVVGGYLPTIRD